MPDNPFLDGKKVKPGKVTVEMLRELADKLNKTKFARGYGWRYSVKINEDGKHYLDRTDY